MKKILGLEEWFFFPYPLGRYLESYHRETSDVIRNNKYSITILFQVTMKNKEDYHYSQFYSVNFNKRIEKLLSLLLVAYNSVKKLHEISFDAHMKGNQ